MKALAIAAALGLSTGFAQAPPATGPNRPEVFARKLFGPQAVLETIPGTIFDTARGFPRQWGRTARGVGKRLGSQYGQFAVGEAIEDPRYFRKPEAHFRQRLRHPLVGTLVVQSVSGKPVIGLARLANVYGGWATATTWNPADQRNALRIAKHGTLGLGMKAAGNVFREFWPDVKRLLKH